MSLPSVTGMTTTRRRLRPSSPRRVRGAGPLRLVAASGAAVLAATLAPLPASAAPADPVSRSAAEVDTTQSVASDGIREGQLDRLLRHVTTEGAIGVTAELVTPDGTWRGAAGHARLDPPRPASTEARFRAASVSKMLVSVLALQLVDRGRWTLDTTLGDVLPDLWPAKDDVTLRQLLSHTSGLPEYLVPLLGTDPSTQAFKRAISERRTDEELVAAARTQPLLPVGEYSYSNTNYVVVGMMLEQATGRSTGALVRQRVLQPARMTRSSWPTTTRMPAPRLQEYGRLYGQVEDLSGFDPSMFSSAGRLVSTARDLDRFQVALSRGALIPRSLVRVMRTPVTDGGGTGPAYGLGTYRLPDPCDPGRFVHGHDGGSWGTITLSYSSPDGSRRVAVSMTGRDYDGDLDAIVALNRVAMTALAQTCGGVPVQSSDPGAPGRLGDV